MIEEWKHCTIGDVLELQRGYDITKKDQHEGPVPVYSSGGLSSYHDTAMTDGPGVVMGRKGTLGRVFYVEGPYWPHDTTLWVRDFKNNSPRFVYHFLQTLDFEYMNVGSANPTLNRNHVHPLSVWWPPIAVQNAIGEVLGALDDKIAANHQVTSTLDALRMLLWMRESRGADEPPLSSHSQFVNGGAYTKNATGTGRVVIRIAELNSGIGASTVYNELDVPDSQVAHAGDLLMSWSGSLTAVRWYREDAIVNQHIFKVVPRDGLPVWAVACAVETKLDEFREIAAGKATTMGHIKRADLDSPVAWPEISDGLHVMGESLWDRALAAEKENLRLAATRDELLPLLMSGKITVKDAEKTVEEVV